MSEKLYEFKPDWLHTIAPGESILERIQDLGLSKTSFAQNMDCSQKHIYKLIKGQASITEDTALRLEKVLGIPASFWVNAEKSYRNALAQKAEVEALAKEADWLKKLPLKDMIKLKWVEKFANKGEQVKACLKFYGVASVSSWLQQQNDYQVAFKAYEKFSMDEVAIQTWLRVGEVNATKITCQPFNKQKLQDALPQLRALTLIDNPVDFVPKLQDICATCGVAVVFAPAPSKCPMSGATKWLSAYKALLMLSVRYKSNDHLWFAFFHEIGHILKHKKQLFLEPNKKTKFIGDKQLEDEADNFASSLLIPKQYDAELAILKTPAAIKKFAKKIAIAPSIVVGRLQHEKIIAFSCCNQLKTKYQWDNTTT